jgi:hypothetical protein
MHALFCLLATFLVTPAWSQDAAEIDIGSRPNVGGPAEVITVSLGLIDIVEVDDRQQQFSVDTFVQIHWQDPRLADASMEEGTFRTLSSSELWLPRLLILNNRGLDFLLPEVASVDRLGNVILRQRLAGPLAADLELHDFPFDTQDLHIDVVSYQYGPDELVFSTDSKIIAPTDKFRSKGWGFEALDPEFSVYQHTEEGAGTSLLRYTIRAERKSVFYVLTLAMPMTLILILAWLVHWLPPTIIPPRIGMSSATVFSLIALGVSFRLTLPAIDYLTRADRFVLLTMLLVAVSLTTAVIASNWAQNDRLDDANRLTKRMRVIFPAIYLGIIVTALVV